MVVFFVNLVLKLGWLTCYKLFLILVLMFIGCFYSVKQVYKLFSSSIIVDHYLQRLYNHKSKLLIFLLGLFWLVIITPALFLVEWIFFSLIVDVSVFLSPVSDVRGETPLFWYEEMADDEYYFDPVGSGYLAKDSYLMQLLRFSRSLVPFRFSYDQAMFLYGFIGLVTYVSVIYCFDFELLLMLMEVCKGFDAKPADISPEFYIFCDQEKTATRGPEHAKHYIGLKPTKFAFTAYAKDYMCPTLVDKFRMKHKLAGMKYIDGRFPMFRPMKNFRGSEFDRFFLSSVDYILLYLNVSHQVFGAASRNYLEMTKYHTSIHKRARVKGLSVESEYRLLAMVTDWDAEGKFRNMPYRNYKAFPFRDHKKLPPI